MDKKRRLIYGLAENGHLYRYRIDEDWTEDLGRVDNWDICRTIFADDDGNVFGSYPPGRIWRYDIARDRVFDLEHTLLPIINQSRTMANPMLDRKAQWRIVEWDAADRAAYGIIGGSNLLFKFEPHAGPEGKVTPLAIMVPRRIEKGDTMDYPPATLTLTMDRKLRRLYYMPVTAGDFDYGAVSRDLPAYSLIMYYDLKTGERAEVGLPRAADGRYAYGMGGAKTDSQGPPVVRRSVRGTRPQVRRRNNPGPLSLQPRPGRVRPEGADPLMRPARPLALVLLATGVLSAQQWVNPHFDTHRLDYRDLGYPTQNLIPADNSRITAPPRALERPGLRRHERPHPGLSLPIQPLHQ